MSKENIEKLIITCEVDVPINANMLDFQIIILEEGFLSRIFKKWRKISYKRATITDLKLEKI